MKRTATIGLALVAAFAFSVIAASAAQATDDPVILVCLTVKETGLWNEPDCRFSDNPNKKGNWEEKLLIKGTNVPFTGASVLGVLEASTGERIDCAKDSSTGELEYPVSVGNVIVTFTGCTGTNSKKEACTAKSPSAKEGEIVTHKLKGEYGLVAASEAASGVGVYLEPVTPKAFVTIQGKCLVEAAVSGSLAGEVTPLNTSSLTGTDTFTGAAGVQKITKIKVLKGEELPALTAFGGLVSASENTTETTTTTTAVEVQ
jgi:hypothetical protein